MAKYRHVHLSDNRTLAGEVCSPEGVRQDLGLAFFPLLYIKSPVLSAAFNAGCTSREERPMSRTQILRRCPSRPEKQGTQVVETMEGRLYMP